MPCLLLGCLVCLYSHAAFTPLPRVTVCLPARFPTDYCHLCLGFTVCNIPSSAWFFWVLGSLRSSLPLPFALRAARALPLHPHTPRTFCLLQLRATYLVPTSRTLPAFPVAFFARAYACLDCMGWVYRWFRLLQFQLTAFALVLPAVYPYRTFWFLPTIAPYLYCHTARLCRFCCGSYGLFALPPRFLPFYHRAPLRFTPCLAAGWVLRLPRLDYAACHLLLVLWCRCRTRIPCCLFACHTLGYTAALPGFTRFWVAPPHALPCPGYACPALVAARALPCARWFYVAAPGAGLPRAFAARFCTHITCGFTCPCPCHCLYLAVPAPALGSALCCPSIHCLPHLTTYAPQLRYLGLVLGSWDSATLFACRIARIALATTRLRPVVYVGSAPLPCRLQVAAALCS